MDDPTAKVCSKCAATKPLTEFYKRGKASYCKACAAVVNATYRATHRDQIAASKAAHHQANREQIAQRQAAHRKAHREEVAAREVVYRATHPHIGWEKLYRRRCRRYGITPVIESFTREDVVARYGDHCIYCPDGAFQTIDHFIPVSIGGQHTIQNCLPTCGRCNSSKAATADLRARRIYRELAA